MGDIPTTVQRLEITEGQIASREGRSTAQVCESFLRAGVASYKEEGTKYLQRFLTQRRPKATDQ